MSPIFTVIVAILAVLAIVDLIVGVSNDAINFLSSALGANVAKRWIILLVASAGIMAGVFTSSGMMEVARNGVFHPAMFSFENVMILFVSVMLSDVVLLNTFNSLGLPTSTTVSMVFELLGAAIAVAVFNIWGNPETTFADLGEYINTGKAMVMISAILCSVVIAFTVGAILQYISRVIFSFRYQKSIRRYGALWCGLSIVGIAYFAIFKGLNSSGLVSDEFNHMVNDNIMMSLFIVWVVSTVLLYVLQMFKVNIMKVTVLAGTFALALAFAGNDLVNFIGVPIAGFDSYNFAMNSGNQTMNMAVLAEPAHANIWFLFAAGVVMIVTLFFSKDAMKVAATQLNLSSQNDEEERFGSTKISRALVSLAINLNKVYLWVMPAKLQEKLNSRFVNDVADKNANYDLIRAVVNLSAAAALICLGTSLKLPLSTTYVIFMVAMGSSLADRAWGRDSAVYRITGVMVVIMGWFITAVAAITMSFLCGLLLMWGGWIALAGLTILCGYLLCRNMIVKKKDKKAKQQAAVLISDEGEAKDVLLSCTQEVCVMMERVSSIYNHMLVALFTENRHLLKETRNESEEIYQIANNRKHHVMSTLTALQRQNVETAHFYIQIVDYLTEVSKALIHCTRPAFEHIDNHHHGLTKEQIMDLKKVNDGVDAIFSKINTMLREEDFSGLDDVLRMRDDLFLVIVEANKNQIHRLKEEKMSTKASLLYLNILTETKTMVLQSRNLIKSQGYFLSQIKDGGDFEQTDDKPADINAE